MGGNGSGVLYVLEYEENNKKIIDEMQKYIDAATRGEEVKCPAGIRTLRSVEFKKLDKSELDDPSLNPDHIIYGGVFTII